MLGKGCPGHRPIPSVCQHASKEGCPKHPMPPHTKETKRTEPQAPCPEFVNTPQKRVVSVLKETPVHAHDRVAAHMSCFSSCTPRAHPPWNALLRRLAAFLCITGTSALPSFRCLLAFASFVADLEIALEALSTAVVLVDALVEVLVEVLVGVLVEALVEAVEV